MLYNKSVMTSLMLIIAVCMSSITTNAFAVDERWKVRLRGIGVIPDDSTDNVFLNNATELSTGVEVDPAAMPELDLTFMITKHWGIEAIASMINHDVNLDANDPTLVGLFGLGSGSKLFDTWVLPPTVTLQYHFMPESNIRPYVGVGVNYTAFLFDDAADSLESALGGASVHVDTENGWGWALQAGLDYDINESWFLNVDVKYIDIDTSAKLGITGGPLSGSNLNVDVDIDPFVVGAGIGYRF